MRVDQHSLNISSLSAPMMFCHRYDVGRHRFRIELIEELQNRFGPFTHLIDLARSGGYQNNSNINWTFGCSDITGHRYASEVSFTFRSREIMDEVWEFLRPLGVKPVVLEFDRSQLDIFGEIPHDIRMWLDREIIEGRFNTTYWKNSETLNHEFLFTDKKAATMFKLAWGGTI